MASEELKQVAKSYDGKRQAIPGIDLEFQHGEFVEFVGPSGHGESSLLRMISVLEEFTAGDITIERKRQRVAIDKALSAPFLC